MFRDFLPDVVQVTGVYARYRSVDKAKALAQEFSIPKVFTNFDELLQEGDFDFAYICNANHVHYEYCRMALEAGRNVIVEKPMCPSLQEVQDLIQSALRHHVYLFEAVTTLHLNNIRKVAEVLPSLGKVRLVECNFSQYSSRYDKYLQHEVASSFDPKCAGGAMMDINIYNVNFVVGLFGLPIRAQYLPNKGWNGIDTSGTLVMRYPDFVALCTGAKDCSGPSHCTIEGERGWLQVVGTPNELPEIQTYIGGKKSKYALNQFPHRMVQEFLEFQEIYLEDNYEKMRVFLDVSLNVIKTIDAAQ